MSRKSRRTLKHIEYYPTPEEIFNTLETSEGWPYKTNRAHYHKRDRALIALLYILACRISEALRLRRNQFIFKKKVVEVRGIKLSKSVRKDKPRREQFRHEAFLSLKGERAKLSLLIVEYLEDLETDAKLFRFGRKRAWQIVNTWMQVPCHWFRAYGENYLYDKWEHDILAVSDYIKVDPRTLQLYIRRGYKKYKPT